MSSTIDSIVKSKLSVIKQYFKEHLNEEQLKEAEEAFEVIQSLASVAARNHNLKLDKIKTKLRLW